MLRLRDLSSRRSLLARPDSGLTSQPLGCDSSRDARGFFGRPRRSESSIAEPRTVLNVLGVLDRGGVECRTLELLEALKGEPVRSIICTLSGRRGELAEAYERAGAQVVPIDVRRLTFPLHFIRLIRAERVDVVHSHVLFASGYILLLAVLAGAKDRIAHFNSDSPDGHRPSPLRRLRYAILRQLINLTSTRVVGVAPNSLDANWGPRWRRDNRFLVLPSGVNLETFRRSSARPLRDELGIRHGTSLIVHLGRADIPTKNRELAVLVVAECRRRGLDIELVFVGRDGAGAEDGERNRAALSVLAEAEGTRDHVRFLGERADVAQILSSSDALLFTSRREGLPGVLIEAVASSTPVVSSDVPGAVYIAQQVAGINIVKLSESVAAWADALSRVLDSNSDGRLGDLSMSLRGSVFDLDSCLESHRELWRLN